MRQSPLLASVVAMATLPLMTSLAQASTPPCSDCTLTLTPPQLVALAERLVHARQFDDARPLVAALAARPDYAMQRHFLAGYIAVETGAYKEAIAEFRAALVQQPKATRIRLELARALMLSGKDGAADYNYRLAQQDDGLPPEILATVKSARNLLRDRRPWHLNADVGIAPDSNITSGTDAETIDITVGNQRLPFQLAGNARRRSGLGQTASLSGGYRFALDDKAALLVDADLQGVNYKGVDADDYTGQVAVGPQYRFDDDNTVSLQGIASQRWYGGKRAATYFGGRGQFQHLLDRGQRIGLTLDARRNNSGFGTAYDGWSLGAYASYERVMMKTFIASGSVFARTDRLDAPAYSNREFGLNLGLGGELPFGINAGISGALSRAVYNAPQLAFSAEPRRDWRYSGRIYLGLRSLRIAGLSPSASWSFSRNDASIDLYRSSRQRFTFALAKYF